MKPLISPHTRNQIADFALIGDCETAALVGRNGSIDWLCWPCFDSEACFAALLGERSNGCWSLRPAAPYQCVRRYRPGTLILESTFETAEGRATVIDFMPPRGDVSHVARIVRGVRGRVRMNMELVLRFGYGLTVPWVTRGDDGALLAIAGPSMVVLRSAVPTQGKDLTTEAAFEIAEGESVPFVLTHRASHMAIPDALDAEQALARTERFWRDWIGANPVQGPHGEAVRRSLITLKAMTFAPTGAMVAAPTTSLPERYGGARNWDYRYSWIRDSTLTLLALMNTGHYDEAKAWIDWLHRAVAGDPEDMQIMYGIRGERRLTEWTADWLTGFEDSRPVRIGNAAHQQFQLDVYGELMDTFHQARVGGVEMHRSIWDLQRALIDHVAKVWSQPDDGIWEVRGPRRRFTFSQVMAWVAIDRAVKSAEQFGLPGPIGDWRNLRQTISDEIWREGFDPVRNTFVQAFGDPGLDASLLLLAQVGFVDAKDAAYVGTVEAIERELLIDGFVQRYRTEQTDDGLPAGEAAFLACSFWLADAYAMIGRERDARDLLEKLLSIRNDVGLLAEEYEPRSKQMAGNFPQAFSHVALVNTVANLHQSLKPNDQRAGRPTIG
jgi:GH15 family glucan-1,4-alpha-glucosidase